MKRYQHHALALAGFLLLAAAFPGRAALYNFTGDYDPGNWEITYQNANPGTYVFNSEETTLTMIGSATPDPGGSDFIISVKAPYFGADSLVGFTWSVTSAGDVGTPVVYYSVGAQQYELLGASGTVTGIGLPANTPIAFEFVSSVSSGKAPASFMVSSWDVEVVPEVGSWMAGIFAIGLVASTFLRRRSLRPTNTSQL